MSLRLTPQVLPVTEYELKTYYVYIGKDEVIKYADPDYLTVPNDFWGTFKSFLSAQNDAIAIPITSEVAFQFGWLTLNEYIETLPVSEAARAALEVLK